MKRSSWVTCGVWALGIWVGSLAGGAAFADTIRPLEPSSEPIHVRVLFEQNPAEEAVIAWTTVGEDGGEDHRLYVDTEPRDGDLEAYQWEFESLHDAPYSLRDDEEEAGMHAWSHNVLLEDLEPATAYYLVAVSDGEQSEEFHFVTAPDDDREVKLLVVGDSRVGGARTHSQNNRRRVNAVMRDLLESHPEIVAMAHGADYTNRAYWSQLYFWLNDHAEATTTEDGRLLPIIPSRGNHDLDVGFEEMFWWPERETDYYYTTMLSDEVGFITLNTEISIGGSQLDWLEAELERVRPQVRWLSGQWHRPAWPSVRDPNASRTVSIRESWVPLLEEYAFDLGYEAHDHALKRTYPIYQNEIDESRGIVYIGDGGGGVSQRRPDDSRWFLEVTGRHHHTHLLTFGDDALHVQAIDINDAIVDEFIVAGGLDLLAGLRGPDAFARHLSAMLADPDDALRDAGQYVLQQFLTHHDAAQPRDRSAFLAQMRETFDDREAPERRRRVAYQLLLLHADHSTDEGAELVRAGLDDPASGIRSLAMFADHVDLDTQAARQLFQKLDTRGAAELREAVVVDLVNQPSPPFPEGRSEGAFEQVDAYELPREGWRFRRDTDRIGYFTRWFEPELDTADWQDIEIGDFWVEFLDEMYVGVGWYRTEIEVPELSDHDALGLHFGGVDENGWVWIDGEYVGQHNIGPEGWDVPFQLDVTDVVEPGSTHQITVRVMNTGANGGIWEPVELRAFRERE